MSFQDLAEDISKGSVTSSVHRNGKGAVFNIILKVPQERHNKPIGTYTRARRDYGEAKWTH